MRNVEMLSKLIEKIELEVLTTEESALIGGSADSILAANNCECDGNNCNCSTPNNCMCDGNNCNCKTPPPKPGGPQDPPKM